MSNVLELDKKLRAIDITHQYAVALFLKLIASILLAWWERWENRL